MCLGGNRMKKTYHLIPLVALTVLSVFALCAIFFMMEALLTVEFGLLVVLDVYYIVSVRVAPFDNKEELFTELAFVVLLFCHVPGATYWFLSYLPYSSPILLLPLVSFVVCLIVLLVKCKHYRLISK